MRKMAEKARVEKTPRKLGVVEGGLVSFAGRW